MHDFAKTFDDGLPYDGFLSRYANDEQRRRWTAGFDQTQITPAQRDLLASFTRDMPVLCLAGAWCGDCAQQCPIFHHFELLSPRIRLRFLDRDSHLALADEVAICGGRRVPVVVFLSEDFFEVARFGDRTLAKYRQMIGDLSAGAACSTGLVAPDRLLANAVVQEWLDQFERAQWILRLSTRLRQKHGD